jgi:hypothetical protein
MPLHRCVRTALPSIASSPTPSCNGALPAGASPKGESARSIAKEWGVAHTTLARDVA